MAGNYPDPSTWRMALDRDGSVVMVMSNAGQMVQFSPTDTANLLNEDSAFFTPTLPWGSGSTTLKYLGVVFPEKRDIDAYMFKMGSSTGSYTGKTVEVSTNTTNMQDGTWTTINAAYSTVPAANINRTSITSATALAVQGIRFLMDESQPYSRTLHLYGEIAPGENPDRLVFWEALTDAKLGPADLDWGDTPRSSSADRVVRVKNVSPTKTAANVRVSFDIVTDSAAPSVPGQFFVSFGGGAFLSQVNVGTLAPGAISGPITVRRVTPSNAQLGLWLPRISAVADSMT